MRRATRLVLLAGFASLAAPAPAAIFVYQAPLSGAQESPPVGSPGTGFTTVTYDDVAHTLRVEATFSNLLGTTTASHIHVIPIQQPPVDVGPVATQLPSFAGFPLGVTSGTYDNIFDLTLAASWNPTFITNNSGTPASAEAALFNALQTGRAYLNIHSNLFPGGEIRGDLQLVPEPATWATMLLGFGLVGASLRYSRRRQAIRFVAA